MRVIYNHLLRVLLVTLPLLAGFLAPLAGQGVISGRILTEENAPVSGVTVFAIGPANAQTITDANGNYFFQLPYGGTYQIQPHYDTLPLNGVSTFDLVILARHLEEIEAITSPYRLIAADADRSGDISEADAIAISNLTSQLTENFPNNTSWRFIDAAYDFPDPDNPFAEAFPEGVAISDFSSNAEGVDFVAVKVGDVNGTAFTDLPAQLSHFSVISGKVFNDTDGNCLPGAGENGPIRWVVKATGALGQMYYGATLADGAYRINVPTGEYTVSVHLPDNDLWEIGCNNAISVSVVALMQEVSDVNFGVQAVSECPLLEVNLATGFLRRCFENMYVVQYSNQGSIVAEDAFVVVTLDPFFDFVSSSVTPSSVSGHVYTFSLGDVPVFGAGSIQIHFVVRCDAALGQTHCIEAEIFPVVECSPPDPNWSGASLVVEGDCVEGQVIFTITNTGDDMTDPVEYIVVEDIMIQLMENVLLSAGQSTQVELPANGATWRLELEQVAFHPDNSYQAAFVEGCGTGNFSYGFINQFPLGDEKPNYDMDCMPNIGAFDPNDKQGFPQGVGEDGFIRPGQPLDYLIRFQNTGTDTAFTVVIRDTLPAWLDPTSVRPGASSHPYAFNFAGDNALQFVFSNIALPDSNVNEPASHGFVRFTIAQKPDVPLGSVIQNRAGIYFDFNEPVITDPTLHTVQENFLPVVSVQEVATQPGIELSVFPNPVGQAAFFRLNVPASFQGRLHVWNGQGQLVSAQPFSGNQLEWSATGLQPGFYFFQIATQQGLRIASGKLVVGR